jgi:hypothetical protein
MGIRVSLLALALGKGRSARGGGATGTNDVETREVSSAVGFEETLVA